MADTDQEVRNQTRLWELIWGCAASQAIHIAAELDIPELLQERPCTCDEIASATSTDAWTLGGVLRVLAACEILAIDPDDRYSLAELGKLLLKTSNLSSRRGHRLLRDYLGATRLADARGADRRKRFRTRAWNDLL
jgi:hypothetical protein